MIDQIQLFKLLKRMFKTNTICYREVADVLSLTPDAVRKIASGDTTLSHERFVLLIRNFKIPHNQWNLSPEDAADKNYVNLDENFIPNYTTYIRNLMQSIEQLATAKGVSINFYADELPIFHMMRYPRITYFKLYCHAYEELKDKFTVEAFILHMDSLGIREIFARIAKAYLTIPCVEIWNTDVMDPMCHQIPFMMELGAFDSKELPQNIVNDLGALIKTIEQYCTEGAKTEGVRFELFRRNFNDMPGMMIAESENGVLVNLKLGKINNVTLQDRYAGEMKSNFRKAINQSVSLSSGFVLEKVRFFKHLNARHKSLRGSVKKQK